MTVSNYNDGDPWQELFKPHGKDSALPVLVVSNSCMWGKHFPWIAVRFDIVLSIINCTCNHKNTTLSDTLSFYQRQSALGSALRGRSFTLTHSPQHKIHKHSTWWIIWTWLTNHSRGLRFFNQSPADVQQLATLRECVEEWTQHLQCDKPRPTQYQRSNYTVLFVVRYFSSMTKSTTLQACDKRT